MCKNLECMYMSIITTITNCRICNNNNLTDVIDLGEQIITSRFPTYGDNTTPKTPIVLCHCSQCGLLQMRQTTNPSELYEYEYGYRSGLNNTMREHLKQYQAEILGKITPKTGDIVIDIGSNDATMLKYWSSEFRRIGVDPTGAQFKQYYCDGVELISDYFTAENMHGVVEKGSVIAISSISMFYDLPDPVKFARDIYELLSENGIWTCEQSYLLTMLKRNSIDTICHEHLEYYALTQVKEIADRVGFNIIDVSFNDCNGGSFRVYFAKKTSSIYEISPKIEKILQEEREYGIMSSDLYKKFMKKCTNEVERLKNFIETANKNNKRVYIYGASTKGNCLLQFAEIGEQHIKYAVERNPAKIGKMTSTGIEIISEETMRANPPEYLLVLPWHFREEIIAREHEFLENGGQFIFPFPHFELYGTQRRVLITGCEGYISKYVIDQFREKATLYGISRSLREKCNNDILTFEMDLLDTSKLENTICTIKPHVIIHLAGISSAYEALCNPIASLQTNGMLVANICDILYRNNMRETRLFNSSSSEMYKGHIDFDVRNETIKNTYHLHPYSIAKIMGTSVVDFYRETHKMPFSNGILFTVESSQKNANFLLNKIAEFLRNGVKDEPLEIGSLNSWRNIVHAKDAARAIYIISMNAPADNYIICNNHSVKMFDIVFELFAKFGIILREGDPGKFYDVNTGKFVLHVCEKPGFEEKPINIRGYCSKLLELGWAPQYSIDDILSEIRNYGGASKEIL